MHINCATMHEFMDVVQGCVERGLTFRADASALTITLLGGF